MGIAARRILARFRSRNISVHSQVTLSGAAIVRQSSEAPRQQYKKTVRKELKTLGQMDLFD